MGRLIHKPGSPFWIARFYANGRDVSRSTKTTDRKTAAAMMRRWEASSRGEHAINSDFRSVLQGLLALELEAKGDAVALAEIRRQRQTMSAQILRESGGGLTIADAWQAWMDTPRKREPKSCTMASYTAAWKRFSGWCAKRGFKDLREIGAMEAEDYTRDLNKESFAPRSYNGHVKFLRSFFKAIRLRAGLVENPFDAATLMEGSTLSRRELSPEELARVFTKATGSMRVMVAVGVFTGLRLGDVCRLKWSNIDFTRHLMTVIPSKTERKSRVVTIPLHPTLCQILREWRTNTPSEQVFPMEAAQYGHNATPISNYFQALFTECGIKTSERVPGRQKPRVLVSFHSLRHSFVSLAAAAGAPQHVIQALVGHGSPAMTSHYTHVDADQRRKAIEALPSLSAASEARQT